MTIIIILIRFFWELPQNIFGLLWLLLNIIIKNINKIEILNRVIFIKLKNGGVSLGLFVFWRTDNYIKNHEYGHSIQSLFFGWLYLLIIGIPSLYNNLISRINKKILDSYYDRYPEKWADRLGGNI